MNQDLPPRPPAAKGPGNPSAVTALVLSTAGLIGWITTITLLLPYEDSVVINVLAFGINFLILVIGSAISGTLSFAGLLTGAVALGSANDRSSKIAAVLGGLGLLAGTGLWVWRIDLVFGQ